MKNYQKHVFQFFIIFFENFSKKIWDFLKFFWKNCIKEALFFIWHATTVYEILFARGEACKFLLIKKRTCRFLEEKLIFLLIFIDFIKKWLKKKWMLLKIPEFLYNIKKIPEFLYKILFDTTYDDDE